MTELAHRLRTVDYFTLGFGTMVGVGWLVLMDDWLERGGPAGIMLGFALGALLLLPVGYAYGRLVMAIPDAGSEIAYTEKVFPRQVSFATGWMMILAYLIVCPWEAVAIGRLAAFMFPALHSVQLYVIGGHPVYLPTLALGLALTAVITAINYRGIHVSAVFQKWTTFGLLTLFALLTLLGLPKGSARNLLPPFSHAGWISVLLMLQVVPYFMTGFESVPKCAEEANPGFRSRSWLRAIVAAILVGGSFYVLVAAVVGWLAPWQALTQEPFATAVAFQHAFGAPWVVKAIWVAAMLSLLKVFNGNFVAASRLLFALGRRGMVAGRVAWVHPENRTPAVAIGALGVVTLAAVLLGDAILVPITEVGSLASAVGWLATCAAYLAIERAERERIIATVGALVALALIAMKVLPFVPGHFSRYEWLALAGWVLLGAVAGRRGKAHAEGVAVQ